MYRVYVLKSKIKNYHYVGMTNNLERRFKDHDEWKNTSTKAYSPFELIYKEMAENSQQAREREKYFKTWKWREELKRLLS